MEHAEIVFATQSETFPNCLHKLLLQPFEWIQLLLPTPTLKYEEKPHNFCKRCGTAKDLV